MIKINKISVLFKKYNSIKICFILFFLFFLSNVTVFKSFIGNFEHYLTNSRYSISQTNSINDDIVIVDIDVSTINKFNIWPFPRNYWSTIINNLNRYKAKVIGIDVLFDSKGANTSQDVLLSNTLKQTNNVILAARKYIQKKNNYSIETWSKPIDIFASTTPFGFINFPYDSDGIVRRSFTSLSSDENNIDSFDYLVVSSFIDSTPTKLKPGLKNSFFNNTDYPSPQFYINYTLSNNFTRVPLYLVYEDRVPNPAIFKDKIVLIGATDPVLNDMIFSPLGILPGVDIHAYNILTLLKNKPIYEFPYLLNLILIYFLLGLISFIVFNYNVQRSSFYVILILSSYSILSIGIFHYFDLIILWSTFIILSITCVLISNLIKLVYEENEKKYIRSLFSQYVSPKVVNELIKSPESLNLGGQKKEISIFFSDIRSFTTLTETYPAETIVEQLNDYLEVMTEPIFEFNGTLDKYVGDEIMAIWGAPLDQNNHAELAVSCAWIQLQKLKLLHKKWEKENKPLFDMGIGINSGTVIVGNIGSSKQKDYTVIGDAVNYAARLEGLTRKFSSDSHICRLIISDTTYNYVQHMCEVKSLGKQPVKGKMIQSEIYEVIHVTPIKMY